MKKPNSVPDIISLIVHIMNDEAITCKQQHKENVRDHGKLANNEGKKWPDRGISVRRLNKIVTIIRLNIIKT